MSSSKEKDSSPFSTVYRTFEQWENAIVSRLIPQPKYYYRIIHYIERHPTASLAEARGHRPKQKVTTEQAEQLKDSVLARQRLGIEIAHDTYRMSYGVKGVPIHSTRERPRYYGFLIQAWMSEPDTLSSFAEDLKNKLIELIEQFLDADETEWWFGIILGYEAPRIMLPNTPQLWGTWEWKAELRGQIVNEKTGWLNQL